FPPVGDHAARRSHQHVSRRSRRLVRALLQHPVRVAAVSEDRDDTHTLARLGYRQELRRAMGAFSNFAISFSIISVLTGIVSTYGVALGAGGPAALGYGWPIVVAGTLVVAVAMGELASAFPTAGALYHWSALLGGPSWGWFTAMV